MKVKNLKKELRDEKVKYDPAFQRRVLWTSQDFSYYLESLTKGWAQMPYTLAEIAACLEHCEEIGDVESSEYFREALSQGKKLISIDAQNRTKKMNLFLKNEFTVTGCFKDADSTLHKLENVFFKDMPQRLQDAINDADIALTIYKDVTRSDLSDIFRRINSGHPLNAHGLRQCLGTPIANWIREEGKRNQPMLKRVVTEEKSLQMLDDELLAKAAMTVMENYRGYSKQLNLGAPDIDSWYKMGKGYHSFDDPFCPYLKEEVDRASGIFKLASIIISQQEYYPNSKLVPLKLFWAVIIVSTWAYDNQYFFHNPVTLFEKLKDIDDRLITESQNDQASLRKQAIENKQDPDDVKDKDYYHNWVRLPHQAKTRNKRKDALIIQIIKQLKDLTLRKRPVKRAA
tara:strand:+ start:120 stop:1319 length:1200 start_codon:yes stop_codon:yes gene_type:complete